MEITDLQKSALQEAGNIGSGHAAIALSQLIDKKIMIAIPSVNIYETVDLKQIINYHNKKLVFINLHVLGDIEGLMIMVIEEDLTFLLCDMVLGRIQGDTKKIDELEQSALMEIGNIVTSSYLNAVSEMTGLSIIISAPKFLSGDFNLIYEIVIKKKVNVNQVENILSITTEFIEESTKIEGKLIFIPYDKAVEKIIKCLNI